MSNFLCAVVLYFIVNFFRFSVSPWIAQTNLWLLENVIENMFPATVKVLHSEKFLTFVHAIRRKCFLSYQTGQTSSYISRYRCIVLNGRTQLWYSWILLPTIFNTICDPVLFYRRIFTFRLAIYDKETLNLFVYSGCWVLIKIIFSVSHPHSIYKLLHGEDNISQYLAISSPKSTHQPMNF